MQVDSVSAVVFFSPNPTRLASFYKTHLGIPLDLGRHGPMQDHVEGWLGDVHVAVLKGRGPGEQGGGVAPTFRVRNLDAFVAALDGSGIEPVRKVVDLGEGKRLASFRDPDGNAFSLIEVAA
jgi:catechol 2,3-dioxygenase-like lactoylglutathione lyase family enzyme